MNGFIRKLCILYSYFLEYMIYVELKHYDKDDDQLEMFMKQINGTCDTINDKSSCLWAISRCYTFSTITRRLFDADLTLTTMENIRLDINKKNKLNFIGITIRPDHVFNLIKIENKWYYISSWMLLYSGVIIKIDSIDDFFDCLHLFFMVDTYKLNRSEQNERFMKFIQTYFIFKLNNNGDNILKINNFSLINQLIYRTGENMIEQMLNLTKFNKIKIIQKESYEFIISSGYCKILENKNHEKIVENFFNIYINSIDKKIFVDSNTNNNDNYIFFYDEYKYFKNNKKIQTKFCNYFDSIYGVNKYIIKIKFLLQKNEMLGGEHSFKYTSQNNMHFINNSYILNQIFMGNIINLQKPGFTIINDNKCNLLMILKYYKLLQYYGHSNIFDNLCVQLFLHYDNVKTYSVIKKYYYIQKNNNNIGKLCLVNIYDHKYLYGFIIFELNDIKSKTSNIHTIIPEFYSENANDYLDQIFVFTNYNDIVYIENVKDIKLKVYNPDIIQIDYCQYLNDCKQYYYNLFKSNNISNPVDGFLFLCNGIKTGNDKLAFRSNDLNYELNNGILFCLIKLLFNENNINNSNNNMHSSMFDLGYIIYGNDYDFYKYLYIELNKRFH